MVTKVLMKPGLRKYHFQKKQKLIKTLKKNISWIEPHLFFQERQNRKDNGDEIFGKDVPCSLRKIKDENLKEYTKLKIQQFSFGVQRGETRNLFQSQDSFISSATPVQTPLTSTITNSAKVFQFSQFVHPLSLQRTD